MVFHQSIIRFIVPWFWAFEQENIWPYYSYTCCHMFSFKPTESHKNSKGNQRGIDLNINISSSMRILEKSPNGLQNLLKYQSTDWKPVLKAPCTTWSSQLPILMKEGNSFSLRSAFIESKTFQLTDDPSNDKFSAMEFLLNFHPVNWSDFWH